MSFQQDLKKYLKLAKLLCVLSTTYDQESMQLSVTKADIIRERVALFVISSIQALTAIIFYRLTLKNHFGEGETSDKTIRIQWIIGSVSRILMIISICVNRKRCFKIVKTIFGVTRLNKDVHCKNLRKYYRLSLLVIFLVAINIWSLLITRRLDGYLMIVVVITQLIPNVYIVANQCLFTCIVISTCRIFEMFNEQLSCLVDSYNIIRHNKHSRVLEIIKKRAYLVNICTSDVNQVYGIHMVLFTIHLFIFITTLPVLIEEILLNWEIPALAKIFVSINVVFCAIASILITYSMPLIANDLESEANKTARILSRISRRGNGIEKMIDKFLIKNMQQKPILTAYGFFPLNKRTLFKIFAAIFTYMVILIQFKDMENTNKEFVSTRTTMSTILTQTSVIRT